jgi:hypothetical protein
MPNQRRQIYQKKKQPMKMRMKVSQKNKHKGIRKNNIGKNADYKVYV